MLVIDGSGSIQFANLAAARMFGRTEADMLRHPIAEYITHAQRTELAESFADYLTAPHTIPVNGGMRWSVLQRTGAEIQVRAGLTPTRAAGKLMVVVTMRVMEAS